MLLYAVVGGVEYGTRPTAAEEDSPDAPLALRADPNPVRSATTLHYTLATAADVRLIVADALGRTVRQINLGARPAGAGEVSVQAAGLAPGMYVVRLAAAGRTAEARIVVAR